MRSVPVITCSPGCVARNAVRNRIAVPAPLMSISYGRRCIASIITSVSSQTERFCGSMSPHDSACMISARLLMLFDAGRAIVALIVWGAVIVYCMMLLFFFQCSEFVSPNVQSSFLYMQSYENYSKLSLKALKTKTILCYFFTTDSSD